MLDSDEQNLFWEVSSRQITYLPKSIEHSLGEASFWTLPIFCLFHLYSQIDEDLICAQFRTESHLSYGTSEPLPLEPGQDLEVGRDGTCPGCPLVEVGRMSLVLPSTTSVPVPPPPKTQGGAKIQICAEPMPMPSRKRNGSGGFNYSDVGVMVPLANEQLVCYSLFVTACLGAVCK